MVEAVIGALQSETVSPNLSFILFAKFNFTRKLENILLLINLFIQVW